MMLKGGILGNSLNHYRNVKKCGQTVSRHLKNLTSVVKKKSRQELEKYYFQDLGYIYLG